MLDERQTFLTLLTGQPLRYGDAAILLCGEDAEPRLAVATEILLKGAARVVVLSGGKDDPPRWIGAHRLGPMLMGKGVAHDRLFFDAASMNTHEQAEACVAHAISEQWHTLLLVASAYHIARAFLTFLAELDRSAQADTIRLVPVAPGHTPWFRAPEGMTATRLELYMGELAKIDAYAALGHVASYARGAAYLQAWEERK